MGVLRDMVQPYTALESWFYDRFIAPGVGRFSVRLDQYFPQELPSAAKILDVGCGGGHNAMSVAERFPDAHITGLDLSAEQIARARKRTARRAERFSWLVGSALEMALPDGSFDLVYSVASLKHWPDPARGVAEMVRVARPGARVIVVEVDRGCRYEDVEAFVDMVGVRGPLRLPAIAAFRTWVAGRSLDVEEARALFADLPLVDATVQRLPGTPAFAMTARVVW